MLSFWNRTEPTYHGSPSAIRAAGFTRTQKAGAASEPTVPRISFSCQGGTLSLWLQKEPVPFSRLCLYYHLKGEKRLWKKLSSKLPKQ
jgi:hypothetical protein